MAFETRIRNGPEQDRATSDWEKEMNESQGDTSQQMEPKYKETMYGKSVWVKNSGEGARAREGVLYTRMIEEGKGRKRVTVDGEYYVEIGRGEGGVAMQKIGMESLRKTEQDRREIGEELDEREKRAWRVVEEIAARCGEGKRSYETVDLTDMDEEMEGNVNAVIQVPRSEQGEGGRMLTEREFGEGREMSIDGEEEEEIFTPGACQQLQLRVEEHREGILREALEVAEEAGVVGHDEEVEMDMELDVRREEWESLVDLVIKETKYTGSRAIAVRNVQNEIKCEKEKRKRFWRDVGDKEGEELEGKRREARKMATTKRRIVEGVVKGMMASKYANLETAEQKRERMEAYKEREKERRKHNEKWHQDTERGRKAREQERKKQGEAKGDGRETTSGERGEMRREVQRLRDEVVAILARITKLEGRMEGSGEKRDNNRERKEGERTWARVAAEAPRRTAEKDEEEEERWKAKNERVRRAVQQEAERLKRQRGVIEVVPNSQPGEGEGDDLVKMAEEAGVPRDKVVSVKMVRGRMQVRIKEGEEEEVVAKINKTRGTEEGRKAARTMESLAGLVVFGIETSWNKEGGMKGLKEWFEKGWKVKLMKEPRWLVNPSDWKHQGTTNAVVIHVARTEERDRMVQNSFLTEVDEEGYTKSRGIMRWGVRIFEQRVRDNYAARGRCTTCTKTGHQWGMCPTRGDKRMSRCGICAEMGHTSYEHKCNTEGCKVTRGACRRHEETEKLRWKCAGCGGNHMVKDCKKIMVAE